MRSRGDRAMIGRRRCVGDDRINDALAPTWRSDDDDKSTRCRWQMLMMPAGVIIANQFDCMIVAADKAGGKWQ